MKADGGGTKELWRSKQRKFGRRGRGRGIWRGKEGIEKAVDNTTNYANNSLLQTIHPTTTTWGNFEPVRHSENTQDSESRAATKRYRHVKRRAPGCVAPRPKAAKTGNHATKPSTVFTIPNCKRSTIDVETNLTLFVNFPL